MTSVPVNTLGVFLDGKVCAYYWNLARQDLARHQLNGGRVKPDLRQAQEALRAAVLSHTQTMSAMSADGHVSRETADIDPESISGGFLSTEAVAERLRVTPRHARRMASEAGIEPVARDAWHSTDIDQLVTQRRGQQR